MTSDADLLGYEHAWEEQLLIWFHVNMIIYFFLDSMLLF